MTSCGALICWGTTTSSSTSIAVAGTTLRITGPIRAASVCRFTRLHLLEIESRTALQLAIDTMETGGALALTNFEILIRISLRVEAGALGIAGIGGCGREPNTLTSLTLLEMACMTIPWLFAHTSAIIIAVSVLVAFPML